MTNMFEYANMPGRHRKSYYELQRQLQNMNVVSYKILENFGGEMVKLMELCGW